MPTIKGSPQLVWKKLVRGGAGGWNPPRLLESLNRFFTKSHRLTHPTLSGKGPVKSRRCFPADALGIQ